MPALYLNLAVMSWIAIASVTALSGWALIRRVGNPMWLVPALYVVSAGASLLVNEQQMPWITFRDGETALYLAYTSLLAVSLMPTFALRGVAVRVTGIRFDRKIRSFLYVAAAAAWFSTLYQVPYAVEALSMGAASVRDLLNVVGNFLLPDSPLTTVAVAVSTFYIVYMILFFYCWSHDQGRVLTLSMLVGSLSYLVSSLAFAARDGALFFLLAIAFVYPLFKHVLSARKRRQFRAMLIIGGTGAIGLLTVMTLSRFGDGAQGTLVYGTLGYIGQQPFVFIDAMVSQKHFYGFSLRAPVLAMLLDQPVEVVRTEAYEWSFGTFLKKTANCARP